MDKITLQDCSLQCRIGVSEEERVKKREIFVDIEMFYNTKQAAKSDEVKDTINYSQVHTILREVVDDEYKLIETLAERISTQLLDKFPSERVIIRVKKPLPKKKMLAIVEVQRP